MQKFKAEINVRLKNGILDPQGQAIAHALQALRFENIDDVRTGKLIEFHITEENEVAARSQIEKACERLLANPVIEDYAFEITKAESRK
jgi:phosphoribosylformylglycinamidine synthase